MAGVEHALAEGADGSLRFRYKGRNALDWAEKRGHVEVATLLRAANREALVPLPHDGLRDIRSAGGWAGWFILAIAEAAQTAVFTWLLFFVSVFVRHVFIRGQQGDRAWREEEDLQKET